MANQAEDPFGVRPLDDTYTDRQLKGNAKVSQARIASDGITQHWPKKDRKGTPDILQVREFVLPLRGMNNMQVSRNKPVTGRSMIKALRWEKKLAPAATTRGD